MRLFDWIPVPAQGWGRPFGGMTKSTANRNYRNFWIPAFAGMTVFVAALLKTALVAVVLMAIIAALVILFLTHPPRLSGFYREAQPWRVFCVWLAWSDDYAL